MKYINLREEAFLKKEQIKKDDFESMVMFLSSYNKAKDMNASLQSLFTVANEKNSELDYTGVLQYKESLTEFVDHTTELLDFEPYYRYFSTDKEKWKSMNIGWVRYMLMLSSSRDIMQTGLTVPSKHVVDREFNKNDSRVTKVQ